MVCKVYSNDNLKTEKIDFVGESCEDDIVCLVGGLMTFVCVRGFKLVVFTASQIYAPRQRSGSQHGKSMHTDRFTILMGSTTWSIYYSTIGHHTKRDLKGSHIKSGVMFEYQGKPLSPVYTGDLT